MAGENDKGWVAPAVPNVGNADGKSGNPGNWNAVWLPKWQDDIHVNTSSLQGIAGASNPNSGTYNYVSSSSDAMAEYGSGEGYMTQGMTNWIDQVAKAIHPLKTGKTLWEDAVAASKSLWTSHHVRKTPYQIVAEWAGDISPKSSGGGSGSSGYGSSGLGTPTPGVDTVRQAMDQVSVGLIGRTLSDKEFARYYEHFKGDFASSGGNMEIGQDAKEFVQKDEDYQEYQVATKFASALDSVLKGAL